MSTVKEWYTTKEAALYLEETEIPTFKGKSDKYKQRYISALIHRGRLPAKKIARDWFINIIALKTFQSHQPGHPKEND